LIKISNYYDLERGTDPSTVHPDPSPPEEPKYESDPELRKKIKHQISEREPKPRQGGIWPYLLIRAFLGDYGVRFPPLNNFWESPDIQVVEGIVSTLEGNTPTLHPIPGKPHTIFVRVWNLGRLAAIGVRLRVYWANPSFSFDDPNSPGRPHYIGGMYLDLSDRYQPGSHIVSRLPTPWRPIFENNGHECLLAKVDSFADRTGPNFGSNIDRHVGQRNLFLAVLQDDLKSLIDSLGQTLPEKADVQMLYRIGDDIRTMTIRHTAIYELGSLGKAVMQALDIQDLTAKTLISAFGGGRADVEPLQFHAFQFEQEKEKISGGYTIYLSTTETVPKFYNRYTILPSYGTTTPPYSKPSRPK
jgi:hypothetical protein